MIRGGAVYIMTNERNTTLYVGVSADLKRRVSQHKTHTNPYSFTARYKLHKVVYYEGFHTIKEAIHREKQIKAGSREKKINLINALNPDWNDLFDEL
ncbi:MAG TPA: GIY-YIG nuclease family protein [Bacteroidia bacterium]|nr:GIY-YIG nuclease family protein [Bacteroidia bacterium]